MFNSKLAGLIAALWLALCAPALAVPGTPVDLSFTDNAGDGTCQIVTSGTVTAGSTIVVLYFYSAAVTPTTSQASIGATHPNGLQALPTSTGAVSRSLTLMWWFNRSDASGTTISFNDGSGTSNIACQAWYIPAVNSTDVKTASLDFATTTTPTIASGTLANSNEILLGYVVRGENNTVTNAGAPWTAMPAYHGFGTSGTRMSYDIVSVTTTVTYNPTFSGTQRGSIGIVSFYQAAAAAANSRTLTGVGQ